jgi:hypothetical protein
LDCGGKRSATPLSHARHWFDLSEHLVRPKAVSPLRSATALQEPSKARVASGNSGFLSVFVHQSSPTFNHALGMPDIYYAFDKSGSASQYSTANE